MRQEEFPFVAAFEDEGGHKPRKMGGL